MKCRKSESLKVYLTFFLLIVLSSFLFLISDHNVFANVLVYKASSNAIVMNTQAVAQATCPSSMGTGATDTLQGTSQFTYMQLPASGSATACKSSGVSWSLTSLPILVKINSTSLRYNVTSVSNGINCNYNPISFDVVAGAGISNQTIWNDINKNSQQYIANSASCASASNNVTLTLGSIANSDFATKIAGIRWVGVGINATTSTRDASTHTALTRATSVSPVQNLYLNLVYDTLATASSTFSYVQNGLTGLNLSWSTPSSNGGETITGYNVRYETPPSNVTGLTSGGADIVINPTSNILYRSVNAVGKIDVINMTNKTLKTTINLGFTGKLLLGVNNQTNEFFNAFNTTTINIYYGSNNTLKKQLSGFTASPVLCKTNYITNKVYCADVANHYYVIDGSTDTLLYTKTIGGTGTKYININPNTNRVYISWTNSSGGITIVNGTSDNSLGKLTHGSAYSLSSGMFAIDYVSNKLYLSGPNDAIIEVYDLSTNKIIGDLSTINISNGRMDIDSAKHIMVAFGGSLASSPTSTVIAEYNLTNNSFLMSTQTNQIDVGSNQNFNMIDKVHHKFWIGRATTPTSILKCYDITTLDFCDAVSVNTGSTSTSYTLTGLTSHTNYEVRVGAINGVGTGTFTTLTSMFTALDAPASLVANGVSTSQINLSWTAPSGTVVGYKIERESPTGNGFSVLVANTTTTVTTYSDTGLTAGTQYNYRVSALNAGGSSSPSSSASAYTTQTAPTSLSMSLITSSTARLSWTNPLTGNFSGFKIDRETPLNGGFVTIVTTTNSSSKYDYSGLVGNTQYNSRVETKYDSTNSTVSSTVSFYTLPTAPSSLTVTESTSKTAHLSWSAPVDNGTINGYFIERSTDGGTSWISLVANTGSTLTTYDDPNLTAGMTYTYRVSTLQYSGTSIPSNIASKTIWQTISVSAFMNDGNTKFAGYILQTNSSSGNNQFVMSSGTATINGLSGLQNFTVKSSSFSFMVYKYYNFNASASSILSLTTNMMLIDCPSNGAGTDVVLMFNETDGHRVSSTTTPTCDSTNIIRVNQTNTANGKSSTVYSSSMKVFFLNQAFDKNPNSFMVNGTLVATSWASDTASSVSYTIGSGLKTFLMYYTLALTTNAGGGGGGGGGGGNLNSLLNLAPQNFTQSPSTPSSFSFVIDQKLYQTVVGANITDAFSINWNVGNDVVVKQIQYGDSVIQLVFPNTPFVLRGSSSTLSHNSIPFTIVVPPRECDSLKGINDFCVQALPYRIPVDVTIGLNNGTSVKQSTVIEVDLNRNLTSPYLVAFGLVGIGAFGMVHFIRINRKTNSKNKNNEKKPKEKDAIKKLLKSVRKERVSRGDISSSIRKHRL